MFFSPSWSSGIRSLRVVTAFFALAAASLTQAHAASYIYSSAPLVGKGTWETTLQGRDLDGNVSNGFEAFYDTDLDITWLVAPNLSGLLYNNDGELSWLDAKAFMPQISIGGIGGWRLPSVQPQNGVTYNTTRSSLGDTDVGYNIKSVKSELSHLYYVTLGNTTSDLWPRIFDRNTDVEIINNSGPFIDLGFQSFWYDELGDAQYQDGWRFSFFGGYQADDYAKSHAEDKYPQVYKNLAWFVHSGDVGTPIPEPHTYALAIAGILTTVAARKKRSA